MTTIALLFLLLVALVQARPAHAADPDSVSFNLDGCDLTQSGADPASYDPDSGDLVCDDPSYVGGNLGKGWEELDLVPFRFTATAKNNAPLTQTYTISLFVDREDAGRPGYDVLSAPVLNTAKSDAACNAPVVGAETILAPGLGGIDKSLYRFVTITQPSGTKCVYDYYARLAVGSHLFPGSSLHANLANEDLDTSGIGAEDRSIPVKEIAPQAINKDMTATRNADHMWSVTKSPTPAELDFTNTCDSTALSAQVQIKVEWERLAATPSGDVTILTHVYATNPADRIITINVTDNVYEGTTQTTLVGTANSGDVDVPKNTAGFLVMTHMFTVSNSASHFNDVATATYKDKVTGVPVPGQTTAKAEADVQPGTTTNTSATITDVESISGAGFSYSVDSFSGASGSFSGGYVAGTETTGNVTWVSGSQTGNGSVAFDKTVYVDGPRIGSGSLSDVATLNASDGFSANAGAAVALTADAKVSLTINKTIPNVLGQGETDAFTFQVTGPNGYSEQVVLNFVAGDTSEFQTLTGLAPGSYTVTETGSASGNWNPQSPQVVNLNLPTCSGAATFNNTYTPAAARVRKVTVPVGTSSGWEFQIVRTDVDPDVVVDTQTIAAGSGFHQLDGDLAEGTYEIRETGGPAGYDLTNVTGGTGVTVVGAVCTFTVDYVADAGDVFDCTFENTQRGRILIDKVTNPSGSPQSFDFTLTGGPSSLNQAFSLTDASAPHDSGAIKPGAGYSAAETVPAGWDLTGATCDDGSDPASIALAAGETVTCTFTNRQDGKIIVVKETTPDGSPQSFGFTASYDADGFSLKDGESNDSGFLNPGSYTVGETVPAGWDLTGATCDDGSDPASIALAAGETVTCTFTNRQDGKIIVVKETTPDGSPQSFGFTASYDADGFSLKDGESNDSGFLNPGSYTVGETVPAGWDLTGATCDDGSDPASIALAAGETVTCTFNNRQDGKIIVVKETTPDGSPQSFGFTASYDADGFSLKDGESNDSGFLNPGSYTVGETVPAGWDLTGATCDDGSDPASIALAAGETVTCTFNNTKRGRILIDKVTNPSGSPQLFDFTLTGGPSALNQGFQLADATAPHDSGAILPGSGYNAGETVPAGWDLTGATCDDGSNVNNIDVGPGETVKCTFTNTKRGKIIVEKQTNPDGAAGNFTFTGDAAGTISDNGTIEVDNLVPGTYTSTEGDPTPSFDLTSIECNDGGSATASSGNVGTRTATFKLDPGETVKCTFTNTKRGKIIVEKQTNPDGAAGNFTFTGDAAGTISDNGTIEVDNLVPGTYTSTEGDPTPSFDLTSIECNDGGSATASSGNVGTRTATFKLDPGETVKCTFTNTKRGKIIVEKQTSPDGAAGNFTFTGDAAGTISDNGTIEVDNLVPGTYTSTEGDPTPNFDLTSIECNDGGSATASSGNVGTRTATFKLDPGETVKCTFTNTKRGKIIVEKQTNPDGAAGSFTFTGDAAGTISDNGTIEVDNLVPGTYTSTEGDPTPNFDLTSIECNDGGSATASSGNVGTRTATFKLDPGETVKCTFTNRQRGMVELLKLTNGAPHPELDIRFTLYRDGPDADPDLTATDVELENLSTLNDADGLLKFQTKLVPGTTYTICENPVPAGWTSLWMIEFQVGGQIVTPYNPNANDSPSQDVGIRCFDFTVQPGQTVQFEVHNDFPGGEPRTIGYWKNWNRCTGGGQAANADKNGGAAAGFYLVEDLLPQLVGDLNVTTCQVAVKILDKSTLAGKKSANDAAYELASQLLAAKLNLAAGAETCGAVQTAVLNGQNLLDAINFNGTGSYLTKSSANRTLALNLASTLDKYNNGNIC